MDGLGEGNIQNIQCDELRGEGFSQQVFCGDKFDPKVAPARFGFLHQQDFHGPVVFTPGKMGNGVELIPAHIQREPDIIRAEQVSFMLLNQIALFRIGLVTIPI